MEKPITPDDVKATMPTDVIQAFNELITRHFNGTMAIVPLSEAASLICDKTGLTRKEVFEKHLLDVEDVYRQAGWEVTYDKPDYNEAHPYDPYFTFEE